MIKSVQRGSFILDLGVNIDAQPDHGTISIEINTVDPTKSLLILYGDATGNTNPPVGTTRAVTLGPDAITFTVSHDRYSAWWNVNPMYWQVVEFY